MAMVFELPQLLDHIRTKTFDQPGIITKCTASSPPRHSIAVSSSLETYEKRRGQIAARQAQQAAAAQKQNEPPSTSDTGAPTAAKAAEKTPEGGAGMSKPPDSAARKTTNIVFTKEKIGKEEGGKTRSMSMLTEQLQNVPAKPKREELQIMIHLSYGKPLRVKCDKNDTVGDVIDRAVKQHAAEYRSPPLNTDAYAYMLRVAEEDGSPDDDMPALNRSAGIGSFGKNYVLLPDPNYKEGKGRSRTRTIGGDNLFVVYFPSNASSKIQFQPELRVSELLRKTCLRRGYAPDDCSFRHVKGEQNVIDNDLTLGELGVMAIKFVTNQTKGEVPPAPPAAVESVDDTWNTSRTIRRQSYNVTIKRTLGHEERVLEVDREKVVTIRKKGGANKKRMMTEVTKVYLNDKAKCFSIEYKDGKTDTYEAETTKESREIVDKIEYIVRELSSDPIYNT